ncbi:hypothetical protein SUGI_0806690 [Cryptomeria japonica]|nr:hypothetical protein SUGI_0806690 [Cryptomeria japonica]
MESKILPSQSLEWKINVVNDTDLKSPNLWISLVRGVSEIFQRRKNDVLCLWRRIWQIGSDDPRRLVHSVKVGLALSLVSLFYIVKTLFNGVGENAIWAVLTVVVVFEFTVGATLSKGLNRCFATMVAGSLGLAVGYLAKCTLSTFSRFIPHIKKRYDYGVVIFILTFSLIAISSYRVENLIHMAYERSLTVMIGCALCFLISVLVFPIWAGDDLQNSIISNLEALAGSIEGCVGEFFKATELEDDEKESDRGCNGYKCVLNSKTTQESWANFARWEPCRGEFFMGYPWKEFVKVGAKMRYCAYTVEALNGLINSEIQAQSSLKEILQSPCTDICRGCGNILRELAKSIRTKTKSTACASMMYPLAVMVVDLQNSVSSLPQFFMQNQPVQFVEKENLEKSSNSEEMSVKEEIVDAHKLHQNSGSDPDCIGFQAALPVATFAFLVIEIAARLESIILAVENLAEKAKFTKMEINESSQTFALTLAKQGVDVDAATSSVLVAEPKVEIDINGGRDQKTGTV